MLLIKIKIYIILLCKITHGKGFDYKLKNIFKVRFLRKSFLYRFSIINILIFTVVLTLLTVIISDKFSDVLKHNEAKYNAMVLRDIGEMLNKQNEALTTLYYNLYYDLNYKTPELSTLLERTESDFDYNSMKMQQKFNDNISSIFNFDSDISYLTFYSKNNDNVYFLSRNSSLLLSKPDYYYTDYLKNVLNQSTEIEILPAFTMHYLNDNNKMVYSYAKNIRQLSSLNNIGTFIVYINVESLYHYIEKFDNDIGRDILVLTKKGEVIFDTSGKYYNKKYPYFDILKSGKDKNGLVEIEGRKYFADTSTNNQPGIFIATLTPEKNITGIIDSTRRTIIIIIVLCLALTISFTIVSTFLFSKRVRTITDSMKNIQSGDFSKKIDINNSEDEIGKIAMGFNKMCDELRYYIDRVYVSEIKQKNSQLSALQAQINPHFLYNTLEAIRMRAVSSGNMDIGDMILILSKLFRKTTKNEAFTNIYEELNYCMLYLELFKARYGDKLLFSIDIEESIKDMGIISHLLQPVIENYIIHGFNPDIPNNHLTIKGFKSENHIIFEIADNGKGMVPEKLAKLQHTLSSCDSNDFSSIGLPNVNERIKIIYGDNCGLSIDSRQNEGTTVIIKILAKSRRELKEYVQGTNRR